MLLKKLINSFQATYTNSAEFLTSFCQFRFSKLSRSTLKINLPQLDGSF